MTKSLHSGASCASTFSKAKRPARFITSGDSGASETTPLSLVYALNIIEVTRVFMGLEQKDLKNATGSIKSSCLHSRPISSPSNVPFKVGAIHKTFEIASPSVFGMKRLPISAEGGKDRFVPNDVAALEEVEIDGASLQVN